LVDYGEKGEVIGLEITAPGSVAADHINEVLKGLGLGTIDAEELAPLVAA
jgi:hypothetical protein